MTSISIIIVNYKTPTLTLKCIEEIYKSKIEDEYEIIIVDNNSQDKSKEIITKKFPNAIWLQNEINEGFGRANNKGIAKAKGEFVLLLNSDVFVAKETIQKCLNKIIADKTIGALGCKLRNQDNSIQKSIYWHDTDFIGILEHNLVYSKLFKVKKNEIKAIMGSFMLLPRELLINTGGFDSDFFMYSEEIELCARIRKLGYKIFYYDEVEALHLHGASSTNKFKSLSQNYLSNALLFYKLRGLTGYLMYNFLMQFNAIINFGAMWFIKDFKEYRKYYKVNLQAYCINFPYLVTIPLFYSRKQGNGKRQLRRN